MNITGKINHILNILRRYLNDCYAKTMYDSGS